MQNIFYFFFQYIKASALNDIKNKSKHQFENGELSAETKKISINSKQAQQDSETNDEIPQIKERSQKRPKQAV